MTEYSTKARDSKRYRAFYRQRLHSVEHVLSNRSDYAIASSDDYNSLTDDAIGWCEMLDAGLIIIDEHDTVVYAD